MERLAVHTEPGRLINAIASIGYDPEVAICDLIDNSIDAQSQFINVVLSPEYHEQDGETDTISRYVIADDGFGMDKEGLLKAFTLGGQRDYPSNSLGKFGLGLKSAGLALGDRIILISKRSEMDSPICAILSIDYVQSTGKYEIEIGDVPASYQEIWDSHSPSKECGTTLVLEQLNENQPPFSKFLPYIRRYCSIIYHLFLERSEYSLEMKVNGEILDPIDPLFIEEARKNGSLQDPLQWNGREVRLLLENHDLPLTSNIDVEIALTHLVHPPTFDVDGQGVRSRIRERYLIKKDPYTRRERHGFYIYRNRRIIVLAERFRGVVAAATQLYAFRGRLMFDERADNILSLDVKKRHCRLPKEARNNLQSIIKTYHAKSKEAWSAAGQRAKADTAKRKEEIANASIAQTPVPNLGYAPGADLSSQADIDNRQRAQINIESDTLAQITDKKVSKSYLTERIQQGNVVIPVDGIKGNAMWVAYPSTELKKAETLINNLHSWISEAYALAENEPSITLILHQLFTILSRAELEVRSSQWRNIPPSTVDEIFKIFRRKVSTIGEDLADTLAAEASRINQDEEDDY